MNTSVVIINPETDGAMPVPCVIEDMGSKIQLKIGGVRGMIVVVEKEALEVVMDGREEYSESASA